jgi:23S rRNA (cytosine1962-C5)-methyltransferase
MQVVGEVVVAPKARDRIFAGHPWVYKSDVHKTKASQPGMVVVLDEKNVVLGHALYSPASQIMLRMFSRGKQPPSSTLLQERLSAAWQRRKQWLPQADAFRVVHGEADFLPGVFIDQYAHAVVLQTSCAGADTLLPAIIEQVNALWDPKVLVLKNDSSTRTREQLPLEVKCLKGQDHTQVLYHEGDVPFHIDVLQDQKTGGFLDQVYNHIQSKKYAFGEALDCFTYHGGFALQMASVCSNVTAYDISEQAIERAQKNAAYAGVRNVDFVKANVLQVLPALYEEGKRFNTIVLDPPAFARGKDTVDKALRAYHEINMRAMKLLKPQGVLISCSCSGRVTHAMFDDMLVKAARDAKRSAHLLESRSAGLDHPVMLGVPETDYLKARFIQVL